MRSRRVEILAAGVVLFLCTSPVLATIHFKDGGIHDIDYPINDHVRVDYESPGLGTTLNILDRARIPFDYHVEGFEDSIINILGGWVYWLDAYNSSQVAVSGGKIGFRRSGGLWVYDSSQVTVSGGSVYKILAYDSSQVPVSGGLVEYLYAYGSSQVTVYGGSINEYLLAFDNSQVTVSGGSINRGLNAYFSSQVSVSGGFLKYIDARGSSQVSVSGGFIGGELRVSHNAVLTMHGWDFAIDGTPVGYTELYSIFGGGYWDEPYRQLTGTLLSGDPLNNQFRIGDNGKIVLVPEPASAVILGLGGFFLVLRRRRRQA